MAKDLSALLGTIQKELGGAIDVTPMGELETPYADRMPFGIFDMDAALKGGLPRGTLCQLFGPDGVGKNLLAYMLMARAQERWGDDVNILYMSFGYAADTPFMRKCGVRIAYSDSELQQAGIDPATATDLQRGRTVGNVLTFGITDKDLAAEQPAEALLTAAIRSVESCDIHLVVIDEMASGETGDDVKKGLHETVKMATWASLVTQFSRKLYTALRKKDAEGHPNSTALLALQPVRANMDAYSAKFRPHNIPSGHALKHLKAIDVHLSMAGFLTEGSDREKVGKKVKWKIDKGKFGLSEGAEGEFEFRFFGPGGTGGIDQVELLADTAAAWGTILRRGANYYFLDYDNAVKGRDAMLAYLRDQDELRAELSEATMHAACTSTPYARQGGA